MISVCIIVKNGAETIRKTLESVSTFSEVLILDNGSTDETLSIAKEFKNVKILESPFIGFGPLRNKVASEASQDWILALDADESLSPPLLQEINTLAKVLNPVEVYSMPRANYYNGKHIKGCGWHPDRVTRLYNRKNTSYCNSEVHESVIPLKEVLLKSSILHTPFRRTSEFLSKMQHYSSLYAKQHAKKRRSSLSKALSHSLFAFIRSYVFQRGFLLGREGFIISLYNSNTVFYKYLKLLEEA